MLRHSQAPDSYYRKVYQCFFVSSVNISSIKEFDALDQDKLGKEMFQV